MKLIGLMVVRNEEWILRASIATALRWCDALVVFDHASTDSTPDIIREARDRGAEIYSVRKDSERWDEMEHRQTTLNAGRAIGGTHFAIVDADELLTANMLQGVREEFADLKPGELLNLPMVPLWRSLWQYRDDGSIWANARITLGFADAPGLTWKPAGDGYQHHHREPYGYKGVRAWGIRGAGGVMHAQFANWPRLVAKHLWYAFMETVNYPGRKSAAELNKQYGQALNESMIRLEQIPARWWTADAELVNLAGAPWQLDDVRRMLREYGEPKFAGLDRRGLAL